ncbi:MAG: peptide chain release factor N(5)-glutamine methyltransferase [Opitutaceae bacterium]
MLTLLEVIKRTTEFFEKHQIESARLNAELLIAHALGIGRMQLYLQFERPMHDAQLELIRPLVRRRGRREPLAYVLGTTAFCDLTLRVDKRVLVPRPETEQLVELIKDSVSTPPIHIADLGTGSGALALALAQSFPGAVVVALDASDDALDVARSNAESAGLLDRVEFRSSNWFSGCGEALRFDVVVSNPPYLTEAEWETAESEVRDHEPRGALVAGDEGCADLLAIIAAAPRWLRPGGGMLFLETGVDQHPRLLAALTAAGLQDVRSHQDWSGRNRFVSARA